MTLRTQRVSPDRNRFFLKPERRGQNHRLCSVSSFSARPNFFHLSRRRQQQRSDGSPFNRSVNNKLSQLTQQSNPTIVVPIVQKSAGSHEVILPILATLRGSKDIDFKGDSHRGQAQLRMLQLTSSFAHSHQSQASARHLALGLELQSATLTIFEILYKTVHFFCIKRNTYYVATQDLSISLRISADKLRISEDGGRLLVAESFN